MTIARSPSRGLTALLGSAQTPPSNDTESLPEGAIVQEIPLHDIAANPDQPRKVFLDGDLQDLAASIKEHGILQPVVVRPNPKRSENSAGDPDARPAARFILIAGERRWRASAIAKLAAIPAIVRSVDDRETLELSLIENLQRAELNPVEQALGFRSLIERFGLTQEELADRLGKSRPAVANVLRLLALPLGVQQMLRDGRLSLGHAKVLLSVPDATIQQRLALRCELQGLSVRTLERMVGAGAPARRVAPARRSPAHIAELERVLREHLGAPVRVREWATKGRIVIEFYSNKEFERILEKIGISASKANGNSENNTIQTELDLNISAK